METKHARPTIKKEGEKSSKASTYKKPDARMTSRKKSKKTKHESLKSNPIEEQLRLFEEPLTVDVMEDDYFHLLPTFSHLTIKKYTGQMSEDLFHGEGVAEFEGGHEYKGRFSKGIIEGSGVFTWADGITYEGEFVRNLPTGEGLYTWSDGSYYKGSVCNGVRHGSGTYKNAQNGVLYIGQWQQSKRHGRGEVYYNEDQTSWYKGDWVMNNREGWGVRCYPSGDVYIGQWKNNLRHGEGSLCWQELEQQYDGGWQEGLQHGLGTHVWLLRRMDGSLYCQSNRYTGEFLMGKRHGRGTFYYASGAIYEGEWRNNRKHGPGKFTSKDCHVYEGEFVDDQLADLSGSRALTPHCALTMTGNTQSVLDTDMTLSIAPFLENFPESKRETEHRQVEFVILRYNRELRAIYTWYSRLGRTQTPDNIFQLSHIQRWRLLKDCHIHHHGYSLTQLDRLVREQSNIKENSSPSSTLLLRRLLSYLVIISYHIYKEEMLSERHILAACLTKLLTHSILPNTSEEKRVKGFVFGCPERGVFAATFIPKCWEIFRVYCKDDLNTSDPPTMTRRELLWMFQKFNLFSSKLTTKMLIKIITAESLDPTNLSVELQSEVNFLEFFEVLVGCAGLDCQRIRVNKKSQSNGNSTSWDSPVDQCRAQGCQSAESASRLTQATASPCAGDDCVCPAIQEEKATKDPHLELWIQMVQQFFNYLFFPMSEHYLLISRKVREDKMSAAQATDQKGEAVELN
ncbi:radial spoke head 10 homolog B [Neosynchiropus ocellatus]